MIYLGKPNFKAVSIIFTALLLLSLLFSCQNTRQRPRLSATLDSAAFTFLHEIPGITEDEIKAVQALREKYDYFTYGMILSTEAFIQNNGETGGFARLFCDWLSGLFGIRFQLVILDGVTHLERLYSGDIDFSGNIMPTPERLETLLMTDTIVERQFIEIRIRGDRWPNHPQRFAFVTGTPGEDAVASVTAPDTYESVWVNNFSEAYEALINGEADAFIVTSVAAANFIGYENLIIENYYPLIFNPISMATAKADLEPVISIVNKALRNGSRPYIGQLYSQGDQDYRKYRMSSMLSDEERIYINNSPVIPIAASSDDYPLSFYNTREREWQGIYFDLLDEVTALTGLRFELVHNEYTSWESIRELLLRGEALIFPELDHTSEWEEAFVWSDMMILNDHLALVSRSDHLNIGINDIPNKRVGIVQNTIYAAAFIEWFPLHPYTIEYASRDEAFKALQNNEVDMVMTSQTRIMQLTHLQELVGFKANFVFRQSIETRLAFSKNESLLLSIVDKALGLTDLERITNTWMQRTYDYRVNIVEAQRPWLISATILSLLVLILVLILFYRNKRMTARIIFANKQAETANKVKNAFLANMSHELRTPLNSTINMVKEAMFSPEQKSKTEALKHAYASSNDLLSVLNTILEISNIESGRLVLLDSPFLIGNVALDINNLFSALCRAKGILWEPKFNVAGALSLKGDRIRLMQALTIMLRNAVKYAHEENGKVSFVIDLLEEADETANIRFEVTDNGIGMTAKKLGELTQMFALDNNDIHYSSSEIMLSVCNGIVKAMGSQIKVESEQNTDQNSADHRPYASPMPSEMHASPMHGSRFSFSLNFPKSEMPAQQEEIDLDNVDFSGKQVLIVDDVAVNRKVLSNILTPTGIAIIEANDGKQALEIFLAKSASIDIILMDIMMPKMDGYEATQEIRASGLANARTVPIIAVTSLTYKEDVDAAINAGMNFHLEKPVEQKPLILALMRFLKEMSKTAH